MTHPDGHDAAPDAADLDVRALLRETTPRAPALEGAAFDALARRIAAAAAPALAERARSAASAASAGADAAPPARGPADVLPLRPRHVEAAPATGRRAAEPAAPWWALTARWAGTAVPLGIAAGLAAILLVRGAGERPVPGAGPARATAGAPALPDRAVGGALAAVEPTERAAPEREPDVLDLFGDDPAVARALSDSLTALTSDESLLAATLRLP